MRRFLLTAFLLSSPLCSFAEDIPLPTAVPFSEPKYTIIKTTSNYTPVREGASTNAGRFSHLKKGTSLFADKDEENFYRIDLGLDKYYWVEKKFVTKDSMAQDKVLPEIKNIVFKDTDKYYTALIKTPFVTAYNEIETGENSLDFILYDVVLDENNLQIEGSSKANFKISKDEFDNLKISYFSNYKLTGHDVDKTDDGLVLKVKKPFVIENKKSPLQGIVITIDPGHGGADPGACAFNLKEKDLNLEISNLLYKELKKEGAEVYMTREEDTNPDLYDRVDFAKEKNSDFLLSIHQNSLPIKARTQEKHGVGVHYYNKEVLPVARSVQKELVEKTGLKDDGINFASLAITRSKDPLCLLIECGYIICEEEAKKLSDKKFQKLLCKAIVSGLENYLTENF